MARDKIKRPFDTPLVTPTPARAPDPFDFDDRDVSQVTDMTSLFKKVEKVDRVLARMSGPVSQIPDVRDQVEETATRVTRVEEKVEASKQRISKLDNKIQKAVEKSHSCHQTGTLSEMKDVQREVVQKVDKDLFEGVKMKTKLESLEKNVSTTGADIEEVKRAPQKLFYSMIGVIVAIITGAGGAVWFLAELNKDVEFERSQRTEQIDRIETQIKEVKLKSNIEPVKLGMEKLEKNVHSLNENTKAFNELCDGMSKFDKMAIRNTLKRRKRRIPVSCLD